MTSRSAYVVGLAIAAATLTGCGGGSSSAGPSYVAPSTPDGMPSIRMTPFPTVSVNQSDPTIVQCRKDVTDVTNAAELFNNQVGYYAPDMKTLVQAHLLSRVPKDVKYGYEQPNIDPTILGTVTGC